MASTRSRLLLAHAQHAVTNVLPPHPDYIATPLCGVEPEPERELGLGTNRIERLVLGNLVFGPRMVPICLNRPELNALRRVDADQLLVDAILHQVPDRLEPVMGCERLHAIEHREDELLRQQCDRLFAMLIAEALQDGTPHRWRSAGEAAEILRHVIARDGGGERARLATLGGADRQRHRMRQCILVGAVEFL
jgi:hypothetical protein